MAIARYTSDTQGTDPVETKTFKHIENYEPKKINANTSTFILQTIDETPLANAK